MKNTTEAEGTSRPPEKPCRQGAQELSSSELLDSYEDQRLLVEIGKSLIAERDRDALLHLILDAARRITGADEGLLFLCESGENGPFLRLQDARNASRRGSLPKDYCLPCDEKSAAGYVSQRGETLNLAAIDPGDPRLPVGFAAGYDLATGYRSRSALVVPMKNRAGKVVGVIQLVNAKENPAAERERIETGLEIADDVLLTTPEDFQTKVVPFKQRYVALMEAVASQAAMALENALMIRRINDQFEAFVHASVAAIESRDPATSGHSERVAALATALMVATDRENGGRYENCAFGPTELLELKYAALLHDFGKVYLDERIFTKAKKLYKDEYDRLVLRIKYLIRSVELDGARRGLEALRERRDEAMDEVERETGERVKALLDALELLPSLIEPREHAEDCSQILNHLLQASPPPEIARDIDGSPLPLLTEDECRSLSISRGSLNAEEYEAIKRHVEYTTSFVSRIPWPPELAGIPEYCAKHHERLDGSGYPAGLLGERIPLQARMLTIADVYDALSARDRPYKKALPFEAVRNIMFDEAKRGRLDQELVRIFFRDGCWRARNE